MKKKKKIILTIVVVLVLIIMGGFYILKKINETNYYDISEKGNMERFSVFLQNEVEKIELAGDAKRLTWKTYHDKKRGFSFQYPDNYEVIVVSMFKYELTDFEKKIWNENDVKTKIQAGVFLCLSENILSNDKVVLEEELDRSSCDFIFEESVSKWPEKQSGTWDMRLASWRRGYIKYAVIDDTTIVFENNDMSGSFPTAYGNNENIIKISALTLIREDEDIVKNKNIFHGIIESLKFE